jgi:hypothetical protein
MKEKCWEIEEVLPVPVRLVGDNVIIPAMSMSYDTFNSIIAGHRHQDIRVGDYASYSYLNGEGEFSAHSVDDYKNWLELYSHIVVDAT